MTFGSTLTACPEPEAPLPFRSSFGYQRDGHWAYSLRFARTHADSPSAPGLAVRTPSVKEPGLRPLATGRITVDDPCCHKPQNPGQAICLSAGVQLLPPPSPDRQAEGASQMVVRTVREVHLASKLRCRSRLLRQSAPILRHRLHLVLDGMSSRMPCTRFEPLNI